MFMAGYAKETLLNKRGVQARQGLLKIGEVQDTITND